MRSVYLYPVIAGWIILIFYNGTSPQPSQEIEGSLYNLSSLGHFVAHLVLAALIYLLANGGAVKRAFSVKAFLTSVVLTIATGVLLELVQLFAPSRSADPLDVLFDGLGAVAGASSVVALDYLRIRRAHSFRAIGGAAVTGIVLLGVWTSMTGSTAIPRFADCAGIFHDTSIIGPPAILRTTETGERVRQGLIALYDFREGSGTVVRDVSGVEPALDLKIMNPENIHWVSGPPGVEFTDVGGAIQSTSAASKLVDFIASSNQLTIEAWVTPDNLIQDGPVRIVTMSEGTQGGQVNFHMGQSTTDTTFRLRTVCRSSNQAIVAEALTNSATPSQLVMTFDGTTPKVFTNGEALPLPNLPSDHFKGDFSYWNADYLLTIGNEASLDRSYLGKIHLIAIYDRALSVDEVRHNFDVGLVDAGG